ncbi:MULTISPECIES: pyridoxal-phosphate dependent enzyme [Xanthomonas]|uniref:Pyridoxal-phosphate dependent enzyme n=1 Tax=Xanthomonas cucurbitae TaxID=56453 RepID=A0A2S7DDL8_9XANT|nr:pyridoxal-phosphate dependent enzyme [Xanthomonas cucurbitae]PPU71925.1 serine dehydratase [Xanthomonas cucurbitae]QHG85911.1 pyridoxal-phosphate dependent enzyme [Xanthomonas cucurbitae]WDM67329.1 pyridoxal-phosphate dependent enzyme [Xanthomonas cucurbitae]WDM71206.1 pyridoxal-phosphate dependent enzyme [Xanthomonas cucurbitae]WDM75814.1 pyridoxal-phosphate dependent enzyme [Xanthomonas cucurbitae]
MLETAPPAHHDVLQAAARIAPHCAPTPVLTSHSLDTLSGAQLFFKAEHLQRSGAFKFRGACNAVWGLSPAQAARGVVTHSSGNHGAALALAARTRGIGCHVVVPEGAVAAKLANISRHGAALWRCAPTIAAREQLCAQVQATTGATLVHPYADPAVIAGQGTATLELLHQSGGLDVLVVPVGGGGLAAGAALALQSAPGCALVLAEPDGAADTARSLAAGQHLVDFVPDTLCDGLRGTLGAPNFALLRAAGAQVLTVDDAAVVQAMRLLWQILKQVVEPSSAITLAAVLADPARFAGRRVGLVLSGGNVDLDALPWAMA